MDLILTGELRNIFSSMYYSHNSNYISEIATGQGENKTDIIWPSLFHSAFNSTLKIFRK